MFVVHRRLLESVCSHQCYHLQEEVMTSGCCVIVQQDNASLYCRDTQGPGITPHRIWIEIIMSTQNEPPHTEDKLLPTPGKVTRENVLSGSFLSFTSSWFQFGCRSHRWHGTSVMVKLKKSTFNCHCCWDLKHSKIVLLYCGTNLQFKMSALGHAGQMAVWGCCDFESLQAENTPLDVSQLLQSDSKRSTTLTLDAHLKSMLHLIFTWQGMLLGWDYVTFYLKLIAIGIQKTKTCLRKDLISVWRLSVKPVHYV